MQSQSNYGSSFLTSNKDITISSSETIILNEVSAAGFSNFSLTITNLSISADQIDIVKIYGSNDKVNYFTLESDVFSSTPIAVDSTVNSHFAAIALYLRVTAISDTNSILDCHLVGLPNGIIASDLPSGSVPSSRQIIAGLGLAGGGDLTADRTLTLDSTAVVLLSLISQQTGSINISSFVEADGGFDGPSLTALSGSNVSIFAPSQSVNVGTGTELGVNIGNSSSTTTFAGTLNFVTGSIDASAVSGVVDLSPGSQQAGFINVSGNIEGDGGFTSTSADATNIMTAVISAPVILSGAYWNGSSSIANSTSIRQIVDSVTPRSHLNILVDGQNFRLYSDGKILLTDGYSATVSDSNTGSIIYNNSNNEFEVSEDGGTYDGIVLLTKNQILTNKTLITPIFSGVPKSSVGAILSSGATITPTDPIHHVSGVGTISTINLPYVGFTGSITLIPDGAWATSTLLGNIGLASVAVFGRTITFTYDGTKWWPSY